MAVDIAAVQAHVYERLVAQGIAGGRVYEEVPFDVTTGGGPYVEIAAGVDVYDDSSESEGVEHMLTLNVWSEEPSFIVVKRIVQAIRTSMNRYRFPSGEADCICWFDGALYLKPNDGVTRQAVVRLRIACRT